MTRKIFALCIECFALAVLLILALPAHAGGWATVGITEMPEEIEAGQGFTIEFMVWQHGNKPVHTLNWNNDRTIPITPRISFSSAEAGEKLMFDAQPAKQPGVFAAKITLPTEGEWLWSIAPEPLVGVTEFDPLSVAPPSKGAAVQTAATRGLALAGVQIPTWTGILALAIAAVAIIFLTYRSILAR